MNIRSKFRCENVQKSSGGNNDSESVELTPVIGGSEACEENKSFSKYTPSGKIEMTITNESAFGAFEVGKEYYVDFTPAE